jgi:hypothetical protein
MRFLFRHRPRLADLGRPRLGLSEREIQSAYRRALQDPQSDVIVVSHTHGPSRPHQAMLGVIGFAPSYKASSARDSASARALGTRGDKPRERA